MAAEYWCKTVRKAPFFVCSRQAEKCAAGRFPGRAGAREKDRGKGQGRVCRREGREERDYSFRNTLEN